MRKLITKKAMDRIERRLKALLDEQQRIGQEKNEAAGEFSSDWHDNFPYEQLDREFQMITKRIGEVGALISEAELFEVVEQSDVAAIGTTVALRVDGADKEITIGGIGESLPVEGLCSYTSPLARLVLGLRPGDAATGTIAGREVRVEVQGIRPPSHRYFALQEKLDSDRRVGEEENGNH